MERGVEKYKAMSARETQGEREQVNQQFQSQLISEKDR